MRLGFLSSGVRVNGLGPVLLRVGVRLSRG